MCNHHRCHYRHHPRALGMPDPASPGRGTPDLIGPNLVVGRFGVGWVFSPLTSIATTSTLSFGRPQAPAATSPPTSSICHRHHHLLHRATRVPYPASSRSGGRGTLDLTAPNTVVAGSSIGRVISPTHEHPRPSASTSSSGCHDHRLLCPQEPVDASPSSSSGYCLFHPMLHLPPPSLLFNLQKTTTDGGSGGGGGPGG